MRPTTTCGLRRSRGARGGFTLIEVMMGSFVLSVSILGMMGLMATSFGMSRSAREMTVAKNAAMRKLEEVRDLARENPSQVIATYGSASNGRSFDVPPLAASSDDADGRTGEIVVEPADVGHQLLDVVVRVRWQSGPSPKSFEIRSRVMGQ